MDNKEITILQSLPLIKDLHNIKKREQLLELLYIHDPVIRVWALSQCLEKNTLRLTKDAFEIATHVARRSSHVRKIFIDYLVDNFAFDLSKKLLELEETDAIKKQTVSHDYIKAIIENDYEAQVNLCTENYLITGHTRWIEKSYDIARSRLGWQKAYVPFLRVLFTKTKSINTVLLSFLGMLEREDAKKEFSIIANAVRTIPNIGLVKEFINIQSYYWNGKYKECVDLVDKSKIFSSKDMPFASTIFNVAANAAEKMEDFKLASAYYDKQNLALQKKSSDPKKYIAGCEARAKLKIKLPKDEAHQNYFIMTGFTRSGTTLLENALNAHPDIQTCEETSSLMSSVRLAYGAKPRKEFKNEDELTNAQALIHRNLYYANINRFIRKKEPKAIIDKTPIISSNIKYMHKLFPEKKYIFCIRHPYDVVLSNYKQNYSQNSAMSAFNDLHTSCVLYNFVMTSWYETFPDKTDLVHYVKYDDLVNDFENVMKGVVKFLNVEWNANINNFVETAKQRAVRTPSYTQVRKGLTIGVQTSWQNFDFLFDEKCKELLDQWVKKFKY